MTQDLTLANQIHDIYESMKPALCKVAMAYRVPNARLFVDEWQSSAFIIAHKFDQGTIEKKIVDEEGNLHKYQPGQDIEFLKSFKGYLKTSFRNDVSKHYAANRRTVIGVSFDPSAADAPPSGDSAGIDEVLVLVGRDLVRATKLQHSLSDKVNIIFLQSLKDSLDDLRRDWGEAQIIQNLDEKDNDRYFQPEFRQALTSKISKRVVRAALETHVPLLFDRLATIALSGMDCAIQKRLYRYLFTYQGGFPARIKKIVL